jgi:hypothetical protein
MKITMYLILLVFISYKPAFGYLDPGSGSMMLQLILGGVAGLALIVKLYWQKLLSLFGINHKKDRKKKQEQE